MEKDNTSNEYTPDLASPNLHDEQPQVVSASRGELAEPTPSEQRVSSHMAAEAKGLPSVNALTVLSVMRMRRKQAQTDRARRTSTA